jgi:prepilin-type processing-associated H-X9-DG protein
LSAYAPLNYLIPNDFTEGASMVPPATDYNSYLPYNDRRLNAYGSLHGNGANFALADGSVRFIGDSIPQAVLRLLCIRNDGEPIPDF